MGLAVIQTGGKQYKVVEGQELLIELVADKKEKDKLQFDDLLGNKKVTAVILKADEQGKKIYVFKYKNKTRYRRKIGHRQDYMKIKIESIK